MDSLCPVHNVKTFPVCGEDICPVCYEQEHVNDQPSKIVPKDWEVDHHGLWVEKK